MEPFLICAESQEIDNGRIYYISNDNRRHWIPSLEVALSYGWNLNTTVKLSMEEVLKYPLSFSIAKQFEHSSSFSQVLPYLQTMQGGGF